MSFLYESITSASRRAFFFLKTSVSSASLSLAPFQVLPRLVRVSPFPSHSLLFAALYQHVVPRHHLAPCRIYPVFLAPYSMPRGICQADLLLGAFLLTLQSSSCLDSLLVFALRASFFASKDAAFARANYRLARVACFLAFSCSVKVFFFPLQAPSWPGPRAQSPSITRRVLCYRHP
jgi:hypothetical protein